jgi:hypothetical protein
VIYRHSVIIININQLTVKVLGLGESYLAIFTLTYESHQFFYLRIENCNRRLIYFVQPLAPLNDFLPIHETEIEVIK